MKRIRATLVRATFYGWFSIEWLVWLMKPMQKDEERCSWKKKVKEEKEGIVRNCRRALGLRKKYKNKVALYHEVGRRDV